MTKVFRVNNIQLLLLIKNYLTQNNIDKENINYSSVKNYIKTKGYNTSYQAVKKYCLLALDEIDFDNNFNQQKE